MNARQKKFVLEKLIPFILRERGRGFGMSRSLVRAAPDSPVELDGIVRPAPSCGSAGCILGSIELLKFRGIPASSDKCGRAIGLTPVESEALFFRWRSDMSAPVWPHSYVVRFRAAKTPLGKAKVAAALLRAVVRTNAKCLHGAGG